MEKQQSGFTLIELVMVIVILGILSAVALPKFVDLFTDAETAAIKGVAGGLAAASAINYAGCATVGHSVTAGKCVKIDKCSTIGTLMAPTLSLGLSASKTSYYLGADTTVSANGVTITCTLKKDVGGTSGAYTADFAGIGAGY